MKEIDINIEGFNVNGICVGCLNYNRKMFYRDIVKDCFMNLAGIDVPDGLSIQVCWECLAAVQNAMRFQEQILNSFEVLSNYSKQHTFLNSPADFYVYATNRLTVSKLEVDIIDPQPCSNEETEPDVKTEKIEVEFDEKLLDDVKKEEGDISDCFPDATEDDFVSQERYDSSEDDMQLSLLKEIKVKTEKKKRGRRRKNEEPLSKPKEEGLQKKRRGLPDIIKVYTITEDEMWALRAADLESKEFSKKKYKCESCLMTFNTEKLMTEHMSSKHKAKGEVCYQCDVCKAYFLSKEHVSAHRALHLTAYRCVSCGLSTSARRRASQHAAGHQPPRRPCPDCGVTFSTRAKLSYHRSKEHKEKLQCDCCGKVFASKLTLKYHLNMQTDEKPKEKVFIPCRGCSKTFHSKKSYQAHVVIHNGLTYPCPICGTMFQWKRNLSRHMRNHREKDAGNKHECRPCGKSFASRECYVNHMKLSKRHVHEESYAHACSYCGKKFATKWCMVDHVDWEHLKRIKYQCNVCFKAFKTAKIMVNHMKNIHEGKKKELDGEHLCEICGKSYKSVKRLKGHVWAMHTNRSTAKSFKCKLCPATFTWQTSIYKHMKMMHDSKRVKPPRAIPSIKKQEPYPDMDMARMPYFQQNVQQSLPVPILPNIV